VQVLAAISFIASDGVAVKPDGIWTYFDKVAVWLPYRVDSETLVTLQSQCGYFSHKYEPARFDYRFKHRLVFRQPNDAALKWIASQTEALINQVEIAVDYTFVKKAFRNDAFEFLHRHLVRRWHGKLQKIKLVVKGRKKKKLKPYEIEGSPTRYDAYRAPNKTVLYRNKYSRITGELNCLHLEWHVNGKEAVRATGIFTGRDLLKFNHHKFWKERLLLYDVIEDDDRVGRYIDNFVTKKKRRQPGPLDGRRGHVILASELTMQELVDRYGQCRIQRLMLRLPTDVWLPPPTLISNIPTHPTQPNTDLVPVTVPA
jgi:hypothetical protein